MIKKCDFPGCQRAGTCRAPKTRDLREYWNFCQRMYKKYPNLYKAPPNEKEEYRRWYKWYKMK